MSRAAKFSIGWLYFITAAAVLVNLFFSRQSQVMDFSLALEPPSIRHFFGTDALGRDLFLRVLSGGAASLSVAAVAVALSTFLGASLGLISGYYAGRVDKAIMSFTDMMLCFPSFFLMLSIIAIFGPNILNVMVILGITGWMGTARLVRAQALSLREREFILAARVIGASDPRILFRHLLPNAAGLVFVNAVLGISSVILAETGLSFLGIGIQPPTPSWGNILADGKATLGVAWWLTLFPGAFIFLTVLSANIFGEDLREKFNS